VGGGGGGSGTGERATRPASLFISGFIINSCAGRVSRAPRKRAPRTIIS